MPPDEPKCVPTHKRTLITQMVVLEWSREKIVYEHDLRAHPNNQEALLFQ